MNFDDIVDNEENGKCIIQAVDARFWLLQWCWNYQLGNRMIVTVLKFMWQSLCWWHLQCKESVTNFSKLSPTLTVFKIRSKCCMFHTLWQALYCSIVNLVSLVQPCLRPYQKLLELRSDQKFWNQNIHWRVFYAKVYPQNCHIQ